MASHRRPHRLLLEEQITKKREKEYIHQQTWNGLTRYYKTFENKNNKYEEWTSPRYYQSHLQMVEQTKREREKKDELEKRREKLRKLYEEEDLSYQIEMTVKTRDRWRSPRLNEIPMELLKDVNIALRQQEEERQRKEAEIALYHQWRRNNPTLRDYERCMRSKELKLSWLDQQIEKRLKKEREVEELKKSLEERDKNLAQLKEEEERFNRELNEKQLRLKQDLNAQIEEMVQREVESERLKEEEEERMRNRIKLEELEEAKQLEEERLKKRELALFNIKHHKLKLKQKALEVEENLKQEQELIEKLRVTQLAETIEDQRKKQEWRDTLDEFLKLLQQQRDLEKKRQKYLDFIFESEAKLMFEKQNEIWINEKMAREKLFDDVLKTIREQIDLKVEENRRRQMTILQEREEILKRIEEYNEELRKAQEELLKNKEKRKLDLDEQVKEKVELKRKLKTLEQKNLDVELEKARREEERLKLEIMALQKKRDKEKRFY